MSNHDASRRNGHGTPEEAFLSIAPVSALMLYEDGQVSAWNEAAEELFGWSETEVLGRLPPFVQESETGRWREHMEVALSGERVSDAEFSLQTIRGGKIRAAVSMAAFESDVGSVLVVVEDRTRLVELTHEVRLFNRVLRHNLRNDLNLVTGYAEMLADELDEERLQSMAVKIRENANDVLSAGETARELDDVVGGIQDLQVVQLDDVVRSLAAEYQAVADVECELEPVAARTIPDVDTAIDHLLENAVRHNDTDEPSVEVTVTTTVKNEDHWAVVTIADNGPGIPETERTVLTDGAETALHHGSGLGLWLVYWIVQKANGELAYEPNEPRGSVVTIRLLTER